MGTLRITYDGDQHCTALAEPPGKTVGTDCPYTGKGEEISPINLLGSALASCMFLSMGAVALRNKMDLSGAYADVEISTVDKPVSRIGAIEDDYTTVVQARQGGGVRSCSPVGMGLYLHHGSQMEACAAAWLSGFLFRR